MFEINWTEASKHNSLSGTSGAFVGMPSVGIEVPTLSNALAAGEV